MSGGRAIGLRAPSFWRECDKSQGFGGGAPNLRIRREATSLDTPAVLLELGGWDIAQSRVQPLLVVDVFQELADLCVGIGEVAVLTAIDLLVLQRFHE